MKRRDFFKSAMALGASTPFVMAGCTPSQTKSVSYEKLDTAANKPVLNRGLFTSPVIIESIELLRYKKNFICRVRSKDGAEGLFHKQ